MEFAVVIPCYNEELTIKNVIEDYKQYFNDIYVIDNNCSDNTAKIALDCGVNIITVATQGKGAAIKEAFSQIDAEYIVLTDGDSTYSAYDSNNLAFYAKSHNYDMVVGNRLTLDSFRASQPKRYSANKIFSRLATKKYKMPICDLLSGSRVVRKDFYKNVELIKDGFEVETELTKKCKNMTYVDITYTTRPAGSNSSIRPIRDGLKILFAL